MANGSSDANYDSAFIDVSPSTMAQEAQHVHSLADEVSQALRAIDERLGQLRLRWWGQAAEEHKRLTDEWEAVSKAMYGYPHHPEAGVLNVLSEALGDAAGNFAKADLGAADTFREFANGLEGHGAPSFEDQTNPHRTAITIDYPDPTGQVEPTRIRTPS